MHRKVPAFATVASAAAIAIIASQTALGHDPRLDTFTAGVMGTPQTAFPMTHARDYAIHIPRLGRSPELEVDAPAYVVVFQGNIELAVVGAPAPQDEAGNALPGPDTAASGMRTISNVVCIVVDGVPNYYGPVDKAGLRP
jgi:hypothetical protein